MSPEEKTARSLIATLHKNGFEAYFAGGCVRDQLLGLSPKDFDIATSAPPEKIISLFKKTIPVGVQFGVVLVVEGGETFEIATFRSEKDYEDGRRPKEVTFSTLEQDAVRRDFTVNGLYYDTKNEKVIDLVEGQIDLKKKLIRSIGPAEVRFQEDHLRMLRAVRFAVKLGFAMDPPVEKAIKDKATLIGKVSQERIREELNKILLSPAPSKGIRWLDELGLLEHFLPEILKMKGVEQSPEHHPEGDVFVHTMLLLDGLKPGDEIELALAALLHDIAKPDTFERAPDRIRFHGHDRIGMEKSRKILKRLTYPNDQIDLVCALVRDHLKFKDVFDMRESTLRRFLTQERFDLHLRLHWLDCMASHKKLEAYEFCKEKLNEYSKLPPPPTRLLTGADLKKMGYNPGKEMGKILTAVEDAILEGDIKEKAEAEAFVKKHFPQPK